MTKYTITGKDTKGKRFVINTDTPQHYNIWTGTLWENLYTVTGVTGNNKRKRIKQYIN